MKYKNEVTEVPKMAWIVNPDDRPIKVSVDHPAYDKAMKGEGGWRRAMPDDIERGKGLQEASELKGIEINEKDKAERAVRRGMQPREAPPVVVPAESAPRKAGK